MMRDAVEIAETRATANEIGVWVLAVASEYYMGQKPQVISDTVNGIWIRHLKEFPAWAIEEAVIWWLGPDNIKKIDTKPKPGHIAARARVEAACLEAARDSINRWEKYKGAYPSFLVQHQKS